MVQTSILEEPRVQTLVRLVEESTRSNKESVKYFIEPAPGVLERAKSKRHHIIFGRRGSGKSSLLNKTVADLTISRTPIAFVDLEEFKGHSYPDVLLSILIKTFTEYKKWLDTAAIHPASKKTFWQRFFGASPEKKAFRRGDTKIVADRFGSMIAELNALLFDSDDKKVSEILKSEQEDKSIAGGKLGARSALAGNEISAEATASLEATKKAGVELRNEYTSKKIEVLHRNIMRYKQLFVDLSELSGEQSFLLLDDLYHIRVNDQPNVVDYFHRISKGASLWIKIGTIRHRSKWYVHGDPPMGMKLGDDADEIDLDVTLEKYDLTKKFLNKILEKFCVDSGLKSNEILGDGGKDRLVLASGGVARDFLTIFRRSVDVARERISRKDMAPGPRISTQDVNLAAGEFDKFKREDFTRDTDDKDVDNLQRNFARISEFCIEKSKVNCFLIQKDFNPELTKIIDELVDLKFIHRARPRVTVRDRKNRLYDAFMLDLSQYTGERARRNVEIVNFWESDAEDSLRKAKIILSEEPRIAAT